MTVPFELRCDDGLGALVDAFKANFEDGHEHGASVCVIRDGDIIAEFFGGWADRPKTVPINDDHLFSVYSCGKAVAALLIAYLAEEDRLGYDQPIASFWPEFAQHGKAELTVAQAMSHQHGISGITNPDWTPADWYDWEKTVAEISAQAPIFPPTSASGYAPIVHGFIAGEIARRTDEYSRHLGTILRQDICDMHNIDVWIGLPAAEHHRSVDMQKPRRLADLGEINAASKAAFMEKWSTPGSKGLAKWLSAQLAGSNTQATAKGMAQLMQIFIDGNIEGEKFLSEDILKNLNKIRIKGQDQVLPFDLNIAAGVMGNYPNFFYGPNPHTVGHSGWGGSCVFADPDAGVTFCYAMTRQDNSLMGDPRSLRIIDALYEAL
ncbi:MAG: beta-lactamase family protein [Hellea sp.]|nr:beta-lactamase family protein [Hellea sp.]